MEVSSIDSALSTILFFFIVVVTEFEKVALGEEALFFTDAFLLFQFGLLRVISGKDRILHFKPKYALDTS